MSTNSSDTLTLYLPPVRRSDDNEYMSFGLSPDRQTSEMIGADVAVAWLDRNTGKGNAVDYYLADKSQCSGRRGSCPDVRIDDTADSVRLLNAALVNDFSIVTYQRPLRASDALDVTIVRNESQAIVWAIGPLNERREVSFHTHFNRKTQAINFGRKPVWNCQLPDGQMSMRPHGATDEDDEDDDNAEVADRNTNAREDERDVADEEDEDEEAPPVYQSRPPSSGSRRPGSDNRRQEIVRREHAASSHAAEPTVLIDDNHRHRNQPAQPPKIQPQHFMSQRHDSSVSPLAAAVVARRPVPAPRPAARTGAWEIPPIQCYEPEDGVFYAQMGPTGGKQGYPAITGHVGWGISWYINGLLIPEINVVRGRTYTFVVESGHDPEVPAKYHPFYITDDPVGGYEYKTDEEKQSVRIFAGVHRSRGGQVSPIGTGRLCNWTPDLDGPPADEYSSFGAYQRSLTLKCDEGEAGIIVWRPDEHTPDTVYYQCFTHRHLGWRINVLDHCDEGQAASEVDAVYAVAPDQQQPLGGDADALLPEPSIRHETKVLPNEIFLLQHEKDLIKNHNMNEVPPRVKFDLNKNLEISKLITEGIRAAEALEESIARPGGIKANRTALEDDQIQFKVVPKPNENQQQPQQQQPHQHQQQQNQNQPQHHHKPSASKEIPQYVSDTSALSEFLRPPGVQNGPLFRPLKVAARPRPASPPAIEMRRPTKNGPLRQTALPQPSIIVNHYKKPVSPLIRPFVKHQKPIQSLAASVLMLGQPTELSSLRKKLEPKFYTEHSGANGPPHASHLQAHKPPKTVTLKGGPFKSGGVYRENYAPKFTHPASPGLPQTGHHSDSIIGQPSSSHATVLRKKPVIREPLLPLKGAKGSFKPPYEITGPKPHSDGSGAQHSGFQPDTVIVEGGFKPIVRRRNGNSNDGDADRADEIMLTSNRRSDDNVPDADQPASASRDVAEDPAAASASPVIVAAGPEGDALFVNQDIPTALFEPMFIPSPPDSINSSSKNKPQQQLQQQQRVHEHLTGDLIDMQVEDGDDKMAMAGERVDAYYLPPDMPRTPPHFNFFPEGSVVTFDGKAVLDTSLVNSLPLPVSTYAYDNVGGGGATLSKTEQLVRNTPQFGPFRGEIPPIGGLDFGPPELPVRFRPHGEQSALKQQSSGAELKTAVAANDDVAQPHGRPVTEYTNPLTNSTAPISTRLVLLNPLPLRSKRGDGETENASDASDRSDDALVAAQPVPQRTIRVKGVVL